jgi:hypothetical protein
VHLTITVQSSGAQRLFDHPVFLLLISFDLQPGQFWTSSQLLCFAVWMLIKCLNFKTIVSPVSTVDLGYDIIKGTEYFVSLQMSVVLIEVIMLWLTLMNYSSNNLTNQMQQFHKFLLNVYVSLNMFRAPPRPSSGGYNCINLLNPSSFFAYHQV